MLHVLMAVQVSSSSSHTLSPPILFKDTSSLFLLHTSLFIARLLSSSIMSNSTATAA